VAGAMMLFGALAPWVQPVAEGVAVGCLVVIIAAPTPIGLYLGERNRQRLRIIRAVLLST